MAYYNQGYPQTAASPPNAANLQFYSSSYNQSVSGHTTPSQAGYGNYNGGATSAAYPSYGSGAPSFATAGVSGRMGEQGGLRTGWLAAFSTEGYDGEPGLMEELGVNFGHIKMKVRTPECPFLSEHGANVSMTDTNRPEPALPPVTAHNGRF